MSTVRPTLYHAPRSASSRILWLLEELQADYELVRVGDRYAAGAQPDARNPHPHGFTPALVHGGQLVTETGAVALYLTDLFPAASVGAAPGDPQRGAYLSWLFYQVGMAEPLVYMRGTKVLERDAAMHSLNEAMVQHLGEVLTQHGPYLLGERFTAADILMMSLLEQARPLLGELPWVAPYLALADRPARRKAQALDAA